jgi:enoyl-CoA hydratase/carnithine racemase
VSSKTIGDEKKTSTTGGGALTIERRKDGVAVLRLDVPGEPVNTLKKDFAPEFRRVCDQLEADASVQAAVLISGKPDGFLAGADITMLEACTTAADAAQLSREGQQAMDRIANLRVPMVAAIHGACLGGGLELALACRGRVASDDRRTRLGLPEVQLGLLPGAGGTQRLPRLIGTAKATEWILTGDMVMSQEALRLGLVNQVVPQDQVLKAAKDLARKIASKSAVAITQSLRAIEAGRELPLAEGLAKEAEAFGAVAASEDSKEGMRAFLEKRQPKFKDR